MSGYKTKLIVAAIDFGITYSGYAWSFTDDYHNDHMKIYTYNNWTDGSGLLTLKTPTVALFEPDGKFDSFGYETENKYAKLFSNNKHTGWKCFRQLKMTLHSTKKLRRNLELFDDQGQSMPAVEVFSASIKYLKDHLMKQLSDRLANIHETEIDWVVTVPAIWKDEGKQFMHEASEKAGIPKDQFQLALEPEAAALYCKNLAVGKAKEEGKETRLKTFKIGAQFMLLDLGGSEIMASAVKNKLNHLKTIIAPEHVDLAVVKGVSTAVPFDPEIHDERNKHYRGGHLKCENIFKVFLRAGTTFIPNQTKVKETIPATQGWNTEQCVEIYRSISETPMYVTDPDCQKVGQIVIKLENKLHNQHRDLDIIMWIDTFLHVECYEHGTKNKHYAQFDFL